MIAPETLLIGGTIFVDAYPPAELGMPRSLSLRALILGTARVSALPAVPEGITIVLDAWITRETALDAWISDPGDVDPPVEPLLDDVLLLEDGDSLVFEDGDDWELEEAA